MIPTKTAQTEDAYINRANLLIEQYLLECSVPGDCEFDPIDMVRWAIQKRQFLRPASWRQYRSSLVFHFEKILDMGQDDPREIIEAIILLKSAGSELCARGQDAPPRTSSFKKRSITKEELQLIVTYLKEHRSRWSFPTMLWIQAAVLTGLRPMEWQSAQVQRILDTGELSLTVKNAKQTNGRANGESRTLVLGEMSTAEHTIIDTHLQMVGNVVHRNLWGEYYRECRNTLYRTTRAIWPNRKSYPTLYTGRHQFSANAKRSGLTKLEVAALLGHSSVETAAHHYGKKRSGVRGMTVTPSERDVARLKLNLQVCQAKLSDE